MPHEDGRSTSLARRRRDEGPRVPDTLKLFREVQVPSSLMNDARLLFRQSDEAKLAHWVQSRPRDERDKIKAVLSEVVSPLRPQTVALQPTRTQKEAAPPRPHTSADVAPVPPSGPRSPSAPRRPSHTLSAAAAKAPGSASAHPPPRRTSSGSTQSGSSRSLSQPPPTAPRACLSDMVTVSTVGRGQLQAFLTARRFETTYKALCNSSLPNGCIRGTGMAKKEAFDLDREPPRKPKAKTAPLYESTVREEALAPLEAWRQTAPFAKVRTLNDACRSLNWVEGEHRGRWHSEMASQYAHPPQEDIRSPRGHRVVHSQVPVGSLYTNTGPRLQRIVQHRETKHRQHFNAVLAAEAAGAHLEPFRQAMQGKKELASLCCVGGVGEQFDHVEQEFNQGHKSANWKSEQRDKHSTDVQNPIFLGKYGVNDLKLYDKRSLLSTVNARTATA